MFQKLLIPLLFLLTAGAQAGLWSHQENEEEECPTEYQYMRAALKHIEGGGIGYNKGYTTLEAFIASDPDWWSVTPFLDLRGHVFDNGKFAANGGIGLRSILGSRVYGINSYYDYRNTRRKGYNQIGLGLETLGELWDLRFN
jgi:hypothetical protein